MQFMLLGFAHLAIVLVRTLILLDNADTSTMLPHAAAVTLYEQTASILRMRVSPAERLTERRARVILLAAYTTCYLLFVGSGIFSIAYVVSIVLALEWVRSLAAPWRLAHLLAGSRVGCSRLLLTMVVESGTAVLASRREGGRGGIGGGSWRLGGRWCRSGGAPHRRRHGDGLVVNLRFLTARNGV